MKIPVTENALFTRLNRKLAKQNLKLRRCSPNARWADFLGRYYSFDVLNNSITGQHIDLEARGREEGVLQDYERLAEEDAQ